VVASSLRFDIFELDPKGCELRRNGLPVDVPPQALKMLTHLVQHADTLVSRDEIRAVLWPNQSHGDFDSRLNFAVRKLREALGDDAERPRYVQTVRNAGYRFIAPVRKSGGVTDLGLGARGPSDKSQETVSRQILAARAGFRFGVRGIVIALAALATVAAAAVIVPRLRTPNRLVEPELKALPSTTTLEQHPNISSVSPILPEARQGMVIKGRGFGFHTPYAQTDSAYLAVRDTTANWAGGRIVPQNWDEVMIDVEHWTDTEIVLSGFSGSYGQRGWKLTAGDHLEIAVWNPQSGAGPALYHLSVSPQKTP
jgi:DNA-binding winged helix-turn-helix (wHTH) protein